MFKIQEKIRKYFDIKCYSRYINIKQNCKMNLAQKRTLCSAAKVSQPNILCESKEFSREKRQKIMKKQTATVTSDFKVVSQTKMFVDRTALLAKTGRRKFIVTAPHRMGKSTMLSMVKTFMERTPDSIERPFPVEENPNYEYFKDLAIGKNAGFMKDHFGQYPVIQVDLTSGVIESKKDALAVLRRAIHEAYVKHEYLIDVLNEETRKDEGYRKVVNKWLDDCWEESSSFETCRALEILAKMLHSVYKQKCYLLVDEYDSITRGAFGFAQNKDIEYIRGTVISSISSLFRCRYAAEYVSGVIITGISNAHTGFRWSDFVGNIPHFEFLGNHGYNDFFALNEEDVSRLLKKFELEHEQKKVHKYYGGYVGENGKHFYNSYSIFQYLRYQTFDTRWMTNGLIKELKPFLQVPKLRGEIEELILGKKVFFDNEPHISEYQDLVQELNYLMSNIQPKDERKMTLMREDMLRHLKDQGYISERTVPNEEVMNALRNDLQEYYHELFQTHREECDACGKCLVDILSATYYDEKKSITLVEESLTLFFRSLCSLLHKTGKPTPYIKEIYLPSLFTSIFSMLSSIRHPKLPVKSTFSTDDNKTNKKEVDFAGAIEDLSIIIEFKVNPVKNFKQQNEMVHLGDVLKYKFLRDTDFCLILAVQLTLPNGSNENASFDVHYDIRTVPECFKTLDKLKPESDEFDKELEKLKNENKDMALDSKNMKKLDLIEFKW